MRLVPPAPMGRRVSVTTFATSSAWMPGISARAWRGGGEGSGKAAKAPREARCGGTQGRFGMCEGRARERKPQQNTSRITGAAARPGYVTAFAQPAATSSTSSTSSTWTRTRTFVRRQGDREGGEGEGHDHREGDRRRGGAEPVHAIDGAGAEEARGRRGGSLLLSLCSL